MLLFLLIFALVFRRSRFVFLLRLCIVLVVRWFFIVFNGVFIGGFFEDFLNSLEKVGGEKLKVIFKYSYYFLFLKKCYVFEIRRKVEAVFNCRCKEVRGSVGVRLFFYRFVLGGWCYWVRRALFVSVRLVVVTGRGFFSEFGLFCGGFYMGLVLFSVVIVFEVFFLSSFCFGGYLFCVYYDVFFFSCFRAFLFESVFFLVALFGFEFGFV